MKLPALNNSTALSTDSQSVEEYIRSATQNMQKVAAAMPGSSGSGVAGAVYLNYNGNNGDWTLSKEVVNPKSLGRILVLEHGFYEGMVEWANGRRLQKEQRQLRGVIHAEPMTEALLKKPLSPGAYRADTDGPKYLLGFIGVFLDDGTPVVFDGSSTGITKAISALATTALQATTAFGEVVHSVIELDGGNYPWGGRTVYYPKLNTVGYITDKRAREAATLSDSDIITRPIASRAKLQRQAKEAPAL